MFVFLGSKVSDFRKHVFCYFRANQGLGWLLSDRGDEVSMCHFKEIASWLKNLIFWHRGS